LGPQNLPKSDFGAETLQAGALGHEEAVYRV
jgi:hypothetical protein